MKRTVLVVLVSLVGCGNVTDPDAAPGDDTVGDPDGGGGETPVDPAVLSFVPTQIRDERGDTIDFSTGEPVHTHAGPQVTLGGADCPEVHHYAYLLDRAPAFGRQITQNPIAFEIAAPTAFALDDAASAYRVVTPEGEVLLEWTSLGEPIGDGRYSIAVHRDDIAELGTHVGPLHVDVRVRDTAGTEQLVTACWDHQPMAAPLAIEAPMLATGPSSLAARTLPVTSQVIDVIWSLNLRPVEVFTQRIVQQTAEPITISIAASAPTGSYATTLVDVFAATATSTIGKDCEAEEAYCDQSPLPIVAPIVRSGALGTGTWLTYVYDDSSIVEVPCTTSGTCTIPPRAPGAAPHAYRIVVMARTFTDLWPSPTLPAINELAIGGHSVVGALLTASKQVRCTNLKPRTFGDEVLYACLAWTEYTEVVALDRARLDVAPVELRMSTAIGAGPLTRATYANGTATTPPLTWDAGDGWL